MSNGGKICTHSIKSSHIILGVKIDAPPKGKDADALKFVSESNYAKTSSSTLSNGKYYREAKVSQRCHFYSE